MAKLRTKGKLPNGMAAFASKIANAAFNPISLYIRRHPELREAVKPSSPRGQEMEQLHDLGRKLTEDFSECIALLENVYDEDTPTLPSILFLGRYQARELIAAEVFPLDLFHVDVADGGVAAVQRIFEATNKRPGELPFDVACWFTGYYAADTPVHTLTLDTAGNCVPALSTSGHTTLAPLDFFARSLRTVKAENSELDANSAEWAKDILGLGDHDALAMGSHVRTTLSLAAVAMLLRFVSKHSTDFAKDCDREMNSMRKRQKEQIDSVLLESRARTKEAVRKVKDELTLVQARLNRTSIDLSRTADRERALLKEVGRLAAPEAAPVAFESVEPVAKDESQSHWRDASEHQAEVIRQLRLALAHAASPAQLAEEAATAPEVVAPRKLTELASWAAENADRVIVLKRAINAAKKSEYHDDEFAFKALDVLATTYREVKLGLRPREELKSECDALGLDIGGSVSFPGAEGDAYYFHWDGRRRFLDQHIGRGNARDPRFCFRAYFTWDEEEGKVIIGWTPTHLPTAST